MWMLQSHGAKVNLQNRDGDTALMTAAKHRDLDAARTLVVAGAKINLYNKRRWTALDAAILSDGPPDEERTVGTVGKAEIIAFLRRHGAHRGNSISPRQSPWRR